MKRVYNKLSPTLTLRDIFGPDLIYNPRASFSGFGWLPKDQMTLDFITGGQLSIVGDMPIICNSCVATKEVLTLLARSNIEVAANKVIFGHESEFGEVIKSFNIENKKLVFNHLHPPKELDSSLYWVDPNLIGFLNNKASIEKLVPEGNYPQRVIVNTEEIQETSRLPLKLPFVIKVASNQPSGGGCDVRICYNDNDVTEALKYFATSLIVVEEYVDITENYCVQFAITFDGQIIYLGTAEQITSSTGQYLGNWVSKQKAPSKEVIELGHSIVKSASRLGYVGICGFDIVVTKDGKIYAIDLNFRLNGSTAALLLRESIVRNYRSKLLLFRSWKVNANWDSFVATINEAIDNADLIALNVYDCLLSPYPKATPLISGILVGNSKEEILEKEKQLLKGWNR